MLKLEPVQEGARCKAPASTRTGAYCCVREDRMRSRQRRRWPFMDRLLDGGCHRCCISHPTKNVNTPTAVSCRSGPILYSGKKNRTTTFSVMRSPTIWIPRAT